MWNSDPNLSRVPYPALLADAADIFATDGNSDVTVILGAPVPWHTNVGLDGCSQNVMDCVDFGL